MSVTVIIYALSHPVTREIRYIGKTISVNRRHREHRQEKRGTRKDNWVRSIRAQGMEPVMEEIESIGCDGDEWEEAEIFWIAYFQFLGARLTNSHEGGMGGHTASSFTKGKMSESQKKKWADPEERRKRIAGLRNAFSKPEVKARLANAMSAVLQRPDVLAAIGAATRARYSDPEQRKMTSAKIRAALSHPDVRKRMSELSKINLAPVHVRQRMSDGQKRRYEDPMERLKKGEETRKRWSIPGERERVGALISAACSTPEGFKRKSEAMKLVAMRRREKSGLPAYTPEQIRKNEREAKRMRLARQKQKPRP